MIARALAGWITSDLVLPRAVEEAALRHLLDGLGTAVAASRTKAAQSAVTVAAGLGGPPEATIVGSAMQVGAPAAALANGTLVHALDFDDTHAGGLVHATAVVLPAVLAVGEEVGASGRRIVDAAVVGYEVACRVAAAAPHGFHTRGLHATMVAGVFSSAAVASRLYGLGADATTQALGIAGSQAGGLLAFLGTGASTKQLHPGFASQAGIIAARLAAAGATGPETVFDGPHGVYDALAAGDVDRSVILDGLGETWETTRIGIKPWPACQLSHASMAAAREALAQAGVTAADVTAVRARVHPDSAAVVCADGRDLAHPASPYAAKFSLPWTVAAMLVDGRVDVTTYAPGQLDRADVSELAARVSWDVVDPGVVAADSPGDVVLSLTDGREVAGHVDRSPGGGSAPLAEADLLAKLAGNVGPLSDRLAAAVAGLPASAGPGPVLRVAAAAAAPGGAPDASRPTRLPEVRP